MKYIEQFREGDRIADVYLCKNVQQLTTKNGKNYINMTLQDKTGTCDAKIWDPNDSGIDDFDSLDYIDIFGDVTVFNGAIQVNVRRVRKCGEGEYNPSDYLPCSRYDIDTMYDALLKIIDSISNPKLKRLAESIYIDDKEFVRKFKMSSAAKTIHHGFVGGLLEHTLYVTKMCEYMASVYTYLNRDLLLVAAMCHDIGKVKEISCFPENDYTDEGQLIGHIVIGYEMVNSYAKKIEDFPASLLSELDHCILSHHGELEYGSPKKPAIAEAIALSFADNMDAKMETMKEALEKGNTESWLGFNRALDSNIRKTIG